MDLAELGNAVVAFARANPDWLAVIAFALAFVEFLPLVMFVLIGVAAIVGVSDPLQLWLMVAATTLGGACGDFFLYWIGRRYNTRIGSIWPFRRHPELLTRSSAFFKRWGEGAVVLGRFLGPVRFGAPVVAGVSRMPSLRFAAATLIGALAWAVVFLWPSALGADWLSKLF